MKPHRIAAGGIVFRGDAVLLVRYRDGDGSYLVGPGGALEEGENAADAVVRETLEETGVAVRPRRVLLVEDLECRRFKMVKIWMLCDVVEGEVRPTDGARAEGIVEASWFTRGELAGKLVYPSPIMAHAWEELRADTWQAECLPSRVAGF